MIKILKGRFTHCLIDIIIFSPPLINSMIIRPFFNKYQKFIQYTVNGTIFPGSLIV